MTNDNPKTPMTQERREAFWRAQGWGPDLSEAERRKIEQEWDDASIEYAESLGY